MRKRSSRVNMFQIMIFCDAFCGTFGWTCPVECIDDFQVDSIAGLQICWSFPGIARKGYHLGTLHFKMPAHWIILINLDSSPRSVLSPPLPAACCRCAGAGSTFPHVLSHPYESATQASQPLKSTNLDLL